MSGTLTVYVYFRSAAQARAQVLAALERQLETIRRACGLAGTTGVRRDRDKPYLTWLEVYEGVAPQQLDAVLAALDRCAQACGLAALALEGRHHEVFEQSPCA